MKRFAVALLALMAALPGLAEETATPLVWEPGQPAIREGGWQRTAAGETSSGRGWESLYPERYSARKELTLETELYFPPDCQGGGGLRAGLHVAARNKGIVLFYFPAEKKLRVEELTRRKDGSVDRKKLWERSAELDNPVVLKLTPDAGQFRIEANGRNFGRYALPVPVFFQSGVSTVDAAVEVRRLRVADSTLWRPVIALGDSITHHCRWQEAVARRFGCKITNCGMAGESTGGTLKRFDDDVLALQPKLVMILIGTNNASGEQAFRDISEMARRLETAKIPLLLCTALPRENLPRITDLNTRLRAFAAERKIVLVDWYDVLKAPDENRMKPEYGTVHPSRDGVEKLADFFAAQPDAAKLLRSAIGEKH